MPRRRRGRIIEGVGGLGYLCRGGRVGGGEEGGGGGGGG